MPWPFTSRATAPARIEPTMAAPPPLEARRESFGMSVGTFGSTASSNVSAQFAENCAAVCGCIGAISSTLASLPARVYRNVDGGRQEVSNHPVARLIRNPCPHLTWPDFAEWFVSQTLLFGNGLAVIEYDGAGRPVGLHPVPWPFVQVMVLESGRLAYNITQFIMPWGGDGLARRYLDSEVLHLRDRSSDGYLGVSRLARAPEVLEGALQLQTFTNSTFRNGTVPSGTITHPAKLSSDGKAYLAEKFREAYAGPTNAKRTVILDEGMKFESSSATLLDSEVLATKLFTVTEIARLYQVPPPIIQAFENNSFTSAETASKWFAQFTLAPWARKIEAAFAKSLFADDSDCHIEIDLAGLMRGDYAARWASYATATQNKILTPNEIREVEGWNPLPDAPAEIIPGTDP